MSRRGLAGDTSATEHRIHRPRILEFTRKSLRFRLVAWYCSLAAVSMLVSDTILFLEFRQLLLGQIDASLEVAAIQAVQNLDDEVAGLEFDPRPDTKLLSSLLSDAGIEIYLLGLDGEVKESFGDSLSWTTGQGVRSGYETLATPTGRWRTFTKEIAPRDGRPPGWLIVAGSLKPIDSTLSNVVQRHLFKLPFLLVMAGLGGLFLASRALKPISQISETIREIRTSGDLSKRIRYDGASEDEIQRLATMFDEMLASLEATFAQQQRFAADTSHELRTPLTTLKGRLQVALSQPRTSEVYIDTLRAIEKEVDRLIRLSTDLLFLSRLEHNHESLDFVEVDLSSLLGLIAAQIMPLAEAKHLCLQTHIEQELRVSACPDHLIRLFVNLLDNAVKYTPPAGRVVLDAGTDNGWVVVRVSDTGIGIPQDQIPHLFERFYRVEQSRSRSVGGAGLGLSIVQELVHSHGGAITVDSEPSSGTTFTVKLKRTA